MIHKLLLGTLFGPAFGFGFASAPTIPSGGGGGGGAPTTPSTPAAPSPAPPPSTPVAPATPSTPTVPAAPSPAPVPGAPPASPTVPSPTNPNDANIEVLRRSHETLQSLGDLNEVRGGLGMYQAAWNEAQSLGQRLGYTDASLQAAFKADLVGTVALLREEARTQAADPNYQRQQADEARIRDMVRRETQPLTEHLARQMADKHNATVDSEFNRMLNASEAFKPRNGIQVPPELQAVIRDRFIESVKWNEPVLKEVMQGKVSGLQQIFDAVQADIMKGYTAYQTWGVQPAPGPGSGPTPPGGTPPRSPTNGQFTGSLDDIIEGRDNANALPSMRGFK